METYETSDSLEFLRPLGRWNEALGGGKAGEACWEAAGDCEVCDEGRRVGNGGARPRAGSGGDMSADIWAVLRRGSGGAPFLGAGRAGTVGLLCRAASGLAGGGSEPPPVCGTGRFGGGGGGGRFPAEEGGDWKFFCLLSAAMRSASVEN